ncbi:type II secretion system secretin GspD [Parvularcula lutaonensis]|uniref:Type II secretion system secretin GspD n=1 Tax=Parvularcula lutaonensis TaxID=491923 RepID=A0ABV7MDB1_9PROT|nr:type II secretion system secretin GspD [Parvularcula lutaonensis]GGY52685.1 type II secretion system protein GspD [Parvularcula lutaonensis]
MRTLLKGLLASSVLVLSGTAAAQNGLASLNYEDADLKVVAAEIAERTGFNFILDPRLSGRVNIISPPGVTMTPEEIFEVFLATLQVNNFTAVPAGDRTYKIVPIEQGSRDAGPVGNGELQGATVTRIFPLDNVDARNAAGSLRGLIGPQGLILPVAESNSLIVVDTGRNVERVRQIIRTVDVDDTVVKTVRLENADATSVAETLDRLNAPGNGENRGGRLEVIPTVATNQLVLRGTARQIARVLPIVEELDRTGGVRGNFDAIYLNHADGEELVPIITQLITGQAAPAGEGSAAAPSNGGPIVTFHQPTNAILVNASPEAQRTIRQLVSQLDIRRPQVMIEAIVVEIANNTARELGVQYLSGGDGLPVTAASFTDTRPNLLSAAGAAYFLAEDTDQTFTRETLPDGTTRDVPVQNRDPNVAAISGQLVTAAVQDLLSFNGFLAGFGDVTDDGGVYGVLLSAIQSDSRSNVLSTPFTMALDNTPARLQVGQEIPVVTGEAVGTDFQGGFRNIERQDVGTILEVTPQINDGDAVTLKIKLEVSSLTAFTAQSDSPILQKSVTEQELTADNGQIIVVGGLVDNDQRNTATKVPLLGDIPLVGNLFKGQSRSEEETTLMVFIRPTIVRDARDADAVTARKYDFARQRQLRAERRKEGPSRLDRVNEELIGTNGSYVVPGTTSGGDQSN